MLTGDFIGFLGSTSMIINTFSFKTNKDFYGSYFRMSGVVRNLIFFHRTLENLYDIPYEKKLVESKKKKRKKINNIKLKHNSLNLK